MRALFLVIDLALEIYIWIVIAAAIFSWLVAFHVVNTRNQAIGMIGEFLYRITEPVLRPIRNFLPNLGGIDISPVVLFLIIIFIRYVIALYILPNVYWAAVAQEPWTAAADGVFVDVRLTPRGGRDAIESRADGRAVVKARVRAAPSEGEANDALCRLLARALDVAPRNVTIATGATARIKRVLIKGQATAIVAAVGPVGRIINALASFRIGA
jgi:YggT family protein